MRTPSILGAIVLATAIVPVSAIHVSAADKPMSAARGERIYTKGESPAAREISASLGGDSTSISAALLPCANCHGADGRGRPEGGVTPSNITWLELTKPYRTETVNGRRRPPYQPASLARAITEGVDSANNPLNPAMPRYSISADDMADLIAYLNVLGRDDAPGVTDHDVVVATLVPGGAAAAVGKTMVAVLSACLADAGEIHGRNVTLKTIELPTGNDAAAGALDRALKKGEPLAFVGGIFDGTAGAIERLVEEREIPLVLPMTTRTSPAVENRERFYLSPTAQQQIEGLLRFSARNSARTLRRISVVDRGGDNAHLAKAAVARLTGAHSLVIIDSARSDAAGRLASEAKVTDVMIFLDPQYRIADLPAALRSDQSRVALLFLSELLPYDFFARSAGLRNVLIAVPTSPADLTARGLSEFRGFAQRHHIAPEHLPAQLAAYTAANLLVSALKTAGRDLTRLSLMNALENVSAFDSGVAPPLSFSRTRRVGSTRVDVASIDPVTKRMEPIGRFDVEP